MSDLYEVGPPRRIKVPKVTEVRLPNGLTVIAVRRAGIPRFQARLRMNAGTSYDRLHGHRSRLSADALLSGTKKRSARDIALDLQSMGASMSAGASLDYISVSGGGLTSGFGDWLDLLAEVLCEPAYPRDEIDLYKSREIQSLAIRLTRPDAIARSRLVKSLYHRHPYGRGIPQPASVAPINRAGIRDFHFRRLRPSGSRLVVVGDMAPNRMIEEISRALRGWRGSARGAAPQRPQISGRPRTVVVDRPDAVQTNIRIGGAAVPRSDPSIFRLAVANTIFGGYFSSRLVENIREDKGYTYSPRSALEHHRLASILTIAADVGSEVTLAALVEIRYELAKMLATSVTESEIESARTYLAGLTSLSLQTQSGLADYLSSLYAAGLDTAYLKSYQANLAEVTVDGVREAALAHLSPNSLTTVLVGNSADFLAQLEGFGPVEVKEG